MVRQTVYIKAFKVCYIDILGYHNVVKLEHSFRGETAYIGITVAISLHELYGASIRHLVYTPI